MADVEREAREARERGQRGAYVGFVGCSTANRILKVAQPDQRRSIRVRCPLDGCKDGEHQTSDSMPRERRRGERCDIGIGGAEAEPGAVDPAPEPTPPHPRTPALRAEQVLAAVSADPLTPAQIAAKLEHPSATVVRRRIQRMNVAAEDRGESPPFTIERAPGPGRRIVIRRAEI